MSLLVKNLTKTYGLQNAVNNVSFSAAKGEIVGFLGPNGAGKSTTMKIATGYLSPTSGTVEVCGHDVRTAPLAVRRALGYLPEHNPLYLDMYVHEYLHFVGSLHGLRAPQLAQRAREMVDLVGLGREQHKKIGALSKGYRQRVGLAQAFIHDPEVLILDEPTTGLDPNQIVEIREVIRQVAREKTVVFSTHILSEVRALCQRAVIIHLGQVVADCPVAELTREQGSFRLTVEFAQPPQPDALASLPGVERAEALSATKFLLTCQQDLRLGVSKLASERGWLLLGMQMEESSREQGFQALTQPTAGNGAEAQ
jgi:ABC-2 type transport system ATP-binding protein